MIPRMAAVAAKSATTTTTATSSSYSTYTTNRVLRRLLLLGSNNNHRITTTTTTVNSSGLLPSSAMACRSVIDESMVIAMPSSHIGGIHSTPTYRYFSTNEGAKKEEEEQVATNETTQNATDKEQESTSKEEGGPNDDTTTSSSTVSNNNNNNKKEQEEALAIRVKELEDRLLRSLAEQENTRQIAKRDVQSARDFSIKSFAKSLLDVSDNLTRALEAVPSEARTEPNSVLATLYEGIVMTDQGLDKAFASNGLQKFCQEPGEKFDPERHQALFEYEDPTKEPGTVGQVMKVGFLLNDRVLRPAEVGVVKKPAT